MFFGALGTQALGEVRRQAVAPPVPAQGGDSTFAGGSAWDERFNQLRPPKKEVVFDDEEGLILAYWYARENRIV